MKDIKDMTAEQIKEMFFSKEELLQMNKARLNSAPVNKKFASLNCEGGMFLKKIDRVQKNVQSPEKK